MLNFNNSAKESAGTEPVLFNLVIKNIGICYAVTIVLIAILAVVVTFMPTPESVVPVSVLVITVISIMLAGFRTAGAMRSNGWLCGMISGVAYIATLYLLGMLVFQNFTFNIGLLIMLAIGAGAGALGGIFGVNAN